MNWDEGGDSPINGGKGSGHAAATAAVNQNTNENGNTSGNGSKVSTGVKVGSSAISYAKTGNPPQSKFGGSRPTETRIPLRNHYRGSS